jgi:hypothetical protein
MTDDETLAQLRRLEPDLASLIALVDDGEVFDCGPFRAMMSLTTGWANLVRPVATPEHGDAVVAAVEEIRRRFAERGRPPRFLFREPLPRIRGRKACERHARRPGPLRRRPHRVR